MEYAKDEVFRINYNNTKRAAKTKKEKKAILLRMLRGNGVIKVITALTVILSVANFILIYHFFRLLSQL